MQFPDGLEDSPFKHTNKRAGWNKRVGGIFFLKINKHADQNKTMQGGIFSQNQ